MSSTEAGSGAAGTGGQTGEKGEKQNREEPFDRVRLQHGTTSQMTIPWKALQSLLSQPKARTLRAPLYL